MLIDLPPKRLLIDPGFCVDIANILHQLDIDFTTQQITLAPWLMDWQGYPAIALPFPRSISRRFERNNGRAWKVSDAQKVPQARYRAFCPIGAGFPACGKKTRK